VRSWGVVQGVVVWVKEGVGEALVEGGEDNGEEVEGVEGRGLLSGVDWEVGRGSDACWGVGGVLGVDGWRGKAPTLMFASGPW